MSKALLLFLLLLVFSCQKSKEKTIQGILCFKETELSQYFKKTRTDDKVPFAIQIITNDSIYRIIRICPGEWKGKIRELDCCQLQKDNKKVIITAIVKNENEVEEDKRFTADQILVQTETVKVSIIDGITQCK